MRREFSDKVKALRFRHCGGFCEGCGIKLMPGNIEYDHDKTDNEGGDNSFENCRVLCRKVCHKLKTARDVRRMADTERLFRRNASIKKTKGRPMPGSRKSGLRKRMDGTVERW